MVALPLALGALMFAGFLAWEARTPKPMLPLTLFRRHNFAFGNIETFTMYGGLGLTFFFLILFLQQVAGFSALAAGTSSLPVTVMMFAFSRRFGMLADRHGPRFFMGVGPLIAAAGIAWFMRLDADVDYVVDLLPGLLVFGLGLSMTVAPLTATVLADADESNAGIASGVNNAIARVAGLVAVAAVGAVVAASFASRLEDSISDEAAARPEVAAAVEDAKTQPLTVVSVEGVPERIDASVRESGEDASVGAFHVGIGISTVLVALGGILGLVGIRNPTAPRRRGRLRRRPDRGAPARRRQPVAVRLGRGGGLRARLTFAAHVAVNVRRVRPGAR